MNVIADAYGLDTRERVSLIEAIGDAMAVGAEFVARHFAAGEPGFVSMVEGWGGMQRWEHKRQWWREHAPSFEAALQHRSKPTSS